MGKSYFKCSLTPWSECAVPSPLLPGSMLNVMGSGEAESHAATIGACQWTEVMGVQR